jgi:hypothetical protein
MRWCVLKVNRFAALNTWRLSCDSINRWSRFLSSIAYGVRRRGTPTSQSTAAVSAAPHKKMANIGLSAVWAGKWATATADCVGGPSELPKCSLVW